MSSNHDKELSGIPIWNRFDPDKVKQKIKKLAVHLPYKNSGNPDVWLSIDLEKVKERINNITAKLEKVHTLSKDGVNSLNSYHDSDTDSCP